MTPWMEHQPIPRPLPKHRTTKTKNKRTHTSMPRLGFELMIPVFQQGEDGSCFRQCGHCDRHTLAYFPYFEKL
jgi:hypothetical protein